MNGIQRRHICKAYITTKAVVLTTIFYHQEFIPITDGYQTPQREKEHEKLLPLVLLFPCNHLPEVLQKAEGGRNADDETAVSAATIRAKRTARRAMVSMMIWNVR